MKKAPKLRVTQTGTLRSSGLESGTLLASSGSLQAQPAGSSTDFRDILPLVWGDVETDHVNRPHLIG